jgi:hypothetical protein
MISTHGRHTVLADDLAGIGQGRQSDQDAAHELPSGRDGQERPGRPTAAIRTQPTGSPGGRDGRMVRTTSRAIGTAGWRGDVASRLGSPNGTRPDATTSQGPRPAPVVSGSRPAAARTTHCPARGRGARRAAGQTLGPGGRVGRCPAKADNGKARTRRTKWQSVKTDNRTTGTEQRSRGCHTVARQPNARGRLASKSCPRMQAPSLLPGPPTDRTKADRSLGAVKNTMDQNRGPRARWPTKLLRPTQN